MVIKRQPINLSPAPMPTHDFLFCFAGLREGNRGRAREALETVSPEEEEQIVSLSSLEIEELSAGGGGVYS